jgi:hypothetical protein
MSRDPSATFGKLVTFCLNDDSNGQNRKTLVGEMLTFGLGIASSVATVYLLSQLKLFV